LRRGEELVVVEKSLGFGHLTCDVGFLSPGIGSEALDLFFFALQSLPFALRRRALAFVRAQLSFVRQLLATIRDSVPLIGDAVSLGGDMLAPSQLSLTMRDSLFALTGRVGTVLGDHDSP
jgi:hypothetical protein